MKVLANYLTYLVTFLKRKSKGFNGYVLGLSGGLDSAVVAMLAKKAVGDKLLVLLISIDSNENDVRDALELCHKHDLKYVVLDLSAEYHALVKNLEKHQPLSDLAKINIKVRLRMVTLYAYAQTTGKLVLGTDNAAELYTGYFTKWGDGAADLLVITSLTKGEVYEAAKLLDVTPAIINKAPSAGLFTGQTDEGEMGVTYADLDAFLNGEEVAPAVKARIVHLHKVSDHKRKPIKRPRGFKK